MAPLTGDRFRRLGLVAVVVLGSASCGPSPSIEATTPNPAPSMVQPSTVASASTLGGSPGPRLADEGRVQLDGLIALAPADAGVWYVRGSEGDGRVGLATVDGSKLEVDAGPAPVAVAATRGAVLLLEGSPTIQGFTQRVDAVERLDPATLAVVSSIVVPGTPTGLAVDGASVWVATANGVAYAYDLASRRLAATVPVGGRGPAHVVIAGGSVWVLNSETDENGTTRLLLHRVDPKAGTVVSTSVLPNMSPFGVITGSDRLWVAAGATDLAAGEGRIYPISLIGAAGEPRRIPTPIALAQYEGYVWWLTAGGSIGALSNDGTSQAAPISVGITGSDLTAATGRLWAASEGLVILALVGTRP